MTIPYITKKQQEIPLLTYRFRFINSLQIQKFMGHKGKRRTNSWLKDLIEKEYLERIYDPKKFVIRLVGMPDIETIVEKAKAAGLESSAKKIMKADFDLNDFYEQMAGVGQIGSFSGIADMLGVGNRVPKDMLDKQQEKTKKWKFILGSMTPKERSDPDIIEQSRIKRIASGSGTNEAEVRELINNYYKTKKMVKQLGLSKMNPGNMAKILRSGGFKF